MALSSLQAFLIESSKSENVKAVVISKRLKEYKFKVRGLSAGEYREVRKRAVNPQGTGGDRIDSLDLARQLIVDGCVEPNFREAEFIKQVGVKTPVEAVDKLLLAGEVSRLSNEIMEISGFNEDIGKLRDEAKNS